MSKNKFNELTRVQMPAMVHLEKLGYKYFGKISESYLLQISNSSTGSRKRAQPEEMLDLNIPIPPKSLRESFSKIAKSITDVYRNNNIAIQQLYKLRDYLLPLLMNGQVIINE